MLALWDLRWRGGVGKFLRKEVTVGVDMIDKWKVMLSRLTAEHAGQPDSSGKFRILSTIDILPPQTICTETYLIGGAFDSKEEAENYSKYLKTKFARFLVSVVAITQQVSKAVFSYVPVQDFSKTWCDKDLYKKYASTPEEIDFIDGMIKEMA